MPVVMLAETPDVVVQVDSEAFVVVTVKISF